MKGKRDIVRRWFQKADSDLKTAKILVEAEDAPTEPICFHAQKARKTVKFTEQVKAFVLHTYLVSVQVH